MMNRYSAGLLILLASMVGLAHGRTTSSGSSTSSSTTSSSLARGALIAIVVCVVVGVLGCCLCAFCLFRVLRRRKAANTTTGGLPMTSTEKPAASTAGDPYGYTGGGYGGPHPPTALENGNGAPQDYNPQAQPYGGQQDYTNNHQNEYNATYNSGQQQTYAPPAGPPMTMPMANHY